MSTLLADSSHIFDATDGPSVEHNIQSQLERHAKAHPEKSALLWVEPSVFNDWRCARRRNIVHLSMNFGSMLSLIESASAGFKRLGVRPGDRVLVCAPHGPDFHIAVAALQRIAAVPVLLHRWDRTDVLRACAQQTRPEVLIAPPTAYSLFGSVPELRDVRLRVTFGCKSCSSYTAEFSAMLREVVTCPVEPVSPQDVALIHYYRGDDRRIYGAHRSHSALGARAAALDAITPCGTDGVELAVFPAFASSNLIRGVTTVLPVVDPAQPDRHDGRALVEQMRATHSTGCSLSPPLMRALAGSASRRVELVPSLERVVSLGMPLSRDDIVALELLLPRAELKVLYETAEGDPVGHITGDKIPLSATGGVPIGELSPGLEARLLRYHPGPVRRFQCWDEWDVGRGPGELIVRGAHVCTRVTSDFCGSHSCELVDDQGQRWHRTGDMCRIDDAGRIVVLGRLDNTIVRDGALVFNVAAETLMNRLPSVDACALIGVPDEELGEKVVAVFKARADLVADHVINDVRHQLQRSAIPFDEVLPVASIAVDERSSPHLSEMDRLRTFFGQKGG